MKDTPPKAPPLYPKSHLLAASGIAALLSLALLVFPSSEVEAKRTNLSLNLEMPDQDVQDQDAPDAAQATPETTESPFAQIDNADDEAQDTATAQSDAEKPAPAKDPNHREVIVSKGDTLSTLFEKVGLPAATVHEVLASDKQAKQFTKLQNGQTLQFELSPDGQLKQLHTKLSELETISLSKSASEIGRAHV